jgi:hypothetical protein
MLGCCMMPPLPRVSRGTPRPRSVTLAASLLPDAASDAGRAHLTTPPDSRRTLKGAWLMLPWSSRRFRWGLLLAALSLLLLVLAAAGCAVAGTSPSGPTVPPATPPPFTTPDAARSAPPQGMAAVTPHLSATPAFTTADVAQYLLRHPLPGTESTPSPRSLATSSCPVRSSASCCRASPCCVLLGPW